MATRIMLDFTATDQSLPKVRREARNVRAGSLALLDFTHPNMPSDWGGVTTGRIPNLAWGPLRNLVGGTESSLSFYYNRTFEAPTDGFVERTSKGGLHVAVKEQPFTAQRSVAIGQEAVAQYLRDNPTHSYYMSVWGRLTRDDGLTGAAGVTQRMVGFVNGANDVMDVRRGTGNAYSAFPTENRLGVVTKPDRSLSPFRIAGAWSSIGDIGTSNTFALWTTVGTSGVIKMPSWVLYALTIEDLTVSGISWAEANQIDAELYESNVTNPSGRYGSDTWTNPSTM